MNQLEIDNLFDNNAWWSDTSTGTMACNTADNDLTIEKLTEIWKELSEPPIIKVWRGNFLPVTTKYPRFHKNSIMETNKAYIVAGVGIICGEEAYERLWNEGYLAVWTNEPPE